MKCWELFSHKKEPSGTSIYLLSDVDKAKWGPSRVCFLLC